MTADPGASLISLGAATIGESGGLPMAPRVHPVWHGARLAAPAFPVRCVPGDNLAIHHGVVAAPRGCVLVVGVGDERERGYWGEILTTAAEARGVVGLVIDGCVRDVVALQDHGFPVFATGVALRGTAKIEQGMLGQATAVGGVTVEAGDWVIGDADGVVVIPASRRDEILLSSRARAAKEAAMFIALRAGHTTIELLDLDPRP